GSYARSEVQLPKETQNAFWFHPLFIHFPSIFHPCDSAFGGVCWSHNKFIVSATQWKVKNSQPWRGFPLLSHTPARFWKYYHLNRRFLYGRTTIPGCPQ